jgi:hypothetical protein
VFREIFLRHPRSSDPGDNGRPTQNRRLIHLRNVTVLEFEVLLTFSYERYVDYTFAGHIQAPTSFSWQEGFAMSILNWVALLSTAHRFKFTDAESRARREVFQRGHSLDPVKRLFLAEKHTVPISFIIPALEELVRRPQPLQKTELSNLSREMIARLCTARERYVRESSKIFASEPWLKQVASNIVK